MSVLVTGSDCRGRDRRHKVRVGASGPHVAPQQNIRRVGYKSSPAARKAEQPPNDSSTRLADWRCDPGSESSGLTSEGHSGGCLRAGRSAPGGGRAAPRTTHHKSDQDGRAWPEGPAAYVAARRLNKLRRYSLRRSAVLRSLASTASLRVRPTRRSVPDLRSARRRSAPDRRSVVPRSIVPGIICLHLCPLHRQTCPLKGRGD